MNKQNEFDFDCDCFVDYFYKNKPITLENRCRKTFTKFSDYLAFRLEVVKNPNLILGAHGML